MGLTVVSIRQCMKFFIVVNVVKKFSSSKLLFVFLNFLFQYDFKGNKSKVYVKQSEPKRKTREKLFS